MSGSTELYVDQQVKADEPQPEVEIKEVDPHAETRASIAERYEQRRLEQIVKDREQMGLPPEEPIEAERPEEVEEVTSPPNHDVARSGTDQRDERTVVGGEAPAPQAPQTPVQAAPVPPQLFPMPLPNGGVTWVTAEQAAQLARIGAAQVYQPPQPPAPPVAEPPKPVFDTDRARGISQRLQYGTPDEQTQALVEFADALRPQTPQQIDVDAIRRQVLQEVRAQTQLDANLSVIGGEFPDIFRDRIRTQVAALTLHELRGNPLNAQKSDLDLYREACKQVQSSIAPPQSQPGSQVTPASQAASPSRLERKRAAPSITAGLDTRVPAAPAEPRAPTNSEIIAQMRKERHQPAI